MGTMGKTIYMTPMPRTAAEQPGRPTEDEDEAPETPPDEPKPVPIDDPPAEPKPTPYVVR